MSTPTNYHIHLATRSGTYIDNIQATALTTLDYQGEVELRRKFTDTNAAVFLTGPCPIYNCHGLTFACRRTKPAPESFPDLLAEDGFVPLPNSVPPQVGDVVLYFEDGLVSHSGLVVQIKEASAFSGKIPFILSKWGSGSEVLHRVDYSPYGNEVKFYRQESWHPQNSKTSATLRPSLTIPTSFIKN